MRQVNKVLKILVIGTAILTGILFCDSVSQQRIALTANVDSLTAQVESLQSVNQSLRNQLEEKSDELKYLEEQYAPFIKILK